MEVSHGNLKVFEKTMQRSGLAHQDWGNSANLFGSSPSYNKKVTISKSLQIQRKFTNKKQQNEVSFIPLSENFIHKINSDMLLNLIQNLSSGVGSQLKLDNDISSSSNHHSGP